MNKQTIGITIGIALMISVVSALYSGECMEIDLSELDNSEDTFYIVTGNSSNLEGLNITLNPITQNAIICTVTNFKPDNFTLIFFNSEKEVIVEHHYSGGGGTRKVYIENKTIEYIEIPNYIDREIIVENKTIEYIEESKKTDIWMILNLLIFPAIIIFLYIKSKKTKE